MCFCLEYCSFSDGIGIGFGIFWCLFWFFFWDWLLFLDVFDRGGVGDWWVLECYYIIFLCLWYGVVIDW